MEIFKFIETNDTDLLSIGSSGHSKVTRFFLGSTAEKILRKAPCSIMTSKKTHIQ
jgi:nucleotide-binding universal stress UspA family protein